MHPVPTMLRQFTITSRHLSANGELVLKAMVSLIKINTGGNWVYTDDATASIAIIDTDKEEGRRTWMEWSGRGLGQALIAYTTKAERFPPGALVLAKPLRSSDLIPLMAQVAERLNSPTTAAAAAPVSNVVPIRQPESVEEPAATPVRTPVVAPVRSPATASAATEGVLERLLRNNHQQPVRMASARCTVVVERSRRLYYSRRPEDLLALMQAAPDQVQLEVLDPEELTTHIQGLGSHELDGPLWQAVLNSSEGRLLDGLSERDTFRLLRWPDFKKLDHKPMHVKLSVFLSKRGGDIPTLTKLSGLDGDKIIDFVNACHALHYLDVHHGAVTAMPIPPVQPTHVGKLGLFAKIRARLGI